MKLFNNIFNSDNDSFFDMLTNISKYSLGELIITDKNFKIIFHNTMLNCKESSQSFFDIVESFINKDIRINIENFKNSDNTHLFLKLLLNDRNNMNNIPVDMHICKIKNKSNKITGYYIIIQDITQEIKNRIQRETFINILSHDLKHPIRANIQILDLILKNKFGIVENNLKNILEELLNSCKFMNYMADNLLIKYKNELNLYELKKQRYSIVQLVKDNCNNLLTFLNKKKQSLEVIIKGEIQDIDIDTNEISKVINNLIINASEQSCESSKIIIKIQQKNNNVIVSVLDNGNPQKKEKLNDIFEEYLSCSNKFRRVGFGLEFYNCKKIIEAHNGVISAKEEANKGTLITFSIPIQH